MARLAKLGVMPGAKFSTAEFDADTRKAIDWRHRRRSAGDPRRRIENGEMINGWQVARSWPLWNEVHL